jgi:hypothetical protein
MSDEPIVDLTEAVEKGKSQRRILPVAVCVLDSVILICCLVGVVSSWGIRSREWTLAACILAMVVLALNILAIGVPSAPSYLALRYRRKCLEEEKRIKELQNP